MNTSKVNINISKIPNFIEKLILSKINFTPYKCYGKPDKIELNVYDNLIKEDILKKYNITINIILSIRSSNIKEKMIKNYGKLQYNFKNIINDYNNNIDILSISTKYDGSPLNLLRLIFTKKYPEIKLKKLFNNPSFLLEHDKKEFKIAYDNDDYGLINQDDILRESELFEEDINKILSINNIKFKTQNDLTKEQIEKYGKPICTPDFLLESTLIINGININWIDAKNFYGSNTSFVKKNIQKQTSKYLKVYGDGAIIFKLGFNEEIEKISNKILFINYDSITNIIFKKKL